jgi:hypothetical protein
VAVGERTLLEPSTLATALQMPPSRHQVEGDVADEVVDGRGEDALAVVVQGHGAVLTHKEAKARRCVVGHQ